MFPKISPSVPLEVATALGSGSPMSVSSQILSCWSNVLLTITFQVVNQICKCFYNPVINVIDPTHNTNLYQLYGQLQVPRYWLFVQQASSPS